MATIYHQLHPFASVPPASNPATMSVVAGSAFPIAMLDFDSGTDESAFWVFRATEYGSGNLTVDIDWYTNSAQTSGSVVWTAAVAVITPNTDSQDLETDTLATANTVTDAHIGTTAQRLHRATVTVSNTDSIAADDWVCLQVTRDANNGSDDLAADASITLVTVSYTAA